MNIFLKMLTTTLAKKLILGAMKEIVKRTDNKLDDEAYKIVEEVIGEWC